MQYVQETRSDLQSLARQRGLPSTGTKDEIAERLRRYDTRAVAPDPPVQPVEPDPIQPASDPADPAEQDTPSPPEEPGTVTTPAVQMPGRPPADPSRTYRVEYPVSGDIFDHEALVRQTFAKAVAAGLTPRGGGNAATSAHRVGFGVDSNGNKTAIYELSVRSERSE